VHLYTAAAGGITVMGSVSVVIPCYNPTRFLKETLASVRAQTYGRVEIILVDDGTDHPEARKLLKSAAGGADRYIEQSNQGLAAARNSGFRAARGDYVVPLDADDRLDPAFVSECVREARAHPEAAFIYTDYRVFGEKQYVERLDDYNLFRLLDQNTLIYASLIRRSDWEAAGGYDDSMRLGYEDWDFWLRLAERGRYGRHLPRALFEYRKHGRSLLTVAREHHAELVAKIRANHPQLYSPEGRARIKAQWAPAVCIVGRAVAAAQTIKDVQEQPASLPGTALERSRAPAFLIPPAGEIDAHSAELCALAVWSGRAATRLPDGCLCASRRTLERINDFREIAEKIESAGVPCAARPAAGRRVWELVRRHLVNAELLSLSSWLRHPLQSAGRLIPLRIKESINRAAGRSVFDLSFYLKFQPKSILALGQLVEPLCYMPRPADRRRIALLTPHLGPGGAESVLLEAAGAIDRAACEIFLIATQSHDSRWEQRWRQRTDHVYDLARFVGSDRMIAAICSIVRNWQFHTIVIQNSLAAYSAIPHLRSLLPPLQIVDWIHAVDRAWDFVSASAPVASEIDLRIVISDAARRRVRAAGVAAEKIWLIRNGVDLERFRPAPFPGAAVKNILFAGRLDPIKRPLLLADIAAELVRLRPARDFHFVVAGDGEQRSALEARIRTGGIEALFSLLGHVEEMPAVVAGCDLVVVPSQAEGIPLIVLEALASQRPVICSRTGAIDEVVDEHNGVLVEPGRREAAEFAKVIDALLSNAGRRREMGEAGRKKIEAEYNLERARQAYRQLFLL
jgi:glycosyltransferase involved in cell wall biosynthesis/GT2 family glycosyltransferase